jgi:hypothetical protein
MTREDLLNVNNTQFKHSVTGISYRKRQCHYYVDKPNIFSARLTSVPGNFEIIVTESNIMDFEVIKILKVSK